MRREPRKQLCETKSRQVLRDLGVESLPVDPIWIAEQHAILVQAKPAESRGVSGMLLRAGDDFAIAYATHIENPGFQRFSIAHELGHYFLPGHPEQLFANASVHHSKAGFGSNDVLELEADHFAAALLMPRPLFADKVREVSKVAQGLDLVIGLRDACETSLLAAAIRYIEMADVPMAIIVSQGGRLSFQFLSPELRAIPGFEWPKKNSMLPVGTESHAFSQDQSRVRSGERAQGISRISDWLGGAYDLEVEEDIIGLGGFGGALTILSFSEPLDLDELELDRGISESNVPRF